VNAGAKTECQRTDAGGEEVVLHNGAVRFLFMIL
jgi:hypothetical protein